MEERAGGRNPGVEVLVLFWSDESVLDLDRSGSHTILWMC
jgi:hypothetical protein